MENSTLIEALLPLQAWINDYALTLTANIHDAEDLAQETNLKLLSCSSTFNNSTNLKSWIKTTMTHLFHHEFKRFRKFGLCFEHCDETHELHISDFSSLNTPDGTIIEHDVMKALNSLPDDMRQPFSLFLAGYKYSDIARQLNLTLSTVKSRIYSVRQNLQIMLEDYQF